MQQRVRELEEQGNRNLWTKERLDKAIAHNLWTEDVLENAVPVEFWVIPGEEGIHFEEKLSEEAREEAPEHYIARTAEIRWKDLSEEERGRFREADQKEWSSILASHAVKVIKPEQAAQIRHGRKAIGCF